MGCVVGSMGVAALSAVDWQCSGESEDSTAICMLIYWVRCARGGQLPLAVKVRVEAKGH